VGFRVRGEGGSTPLEVRVAFWADAPCSVTIASCAGGAVRSSALHWLCCVQTCGVGGGGG